MTNPTLSDLAQLLNSELPAAMTDLSAEEIAKLIELIETAVATQDSEIRRAERDVVRHVPLPLRAPVKRMLR